MPEHSCTEGAARDGPHCDREKLLPAHEQAAGPHCRARAPHGSALPVRALPGADTELRVLCSPFVPSFDEAEATPSLVRRAPVSSHENQ